MENQDPLGCITEYYGMEIQKQGYSCNFSIALSHPVPSVIIFPAEFGQKVVLKQLRSDLTKTAMKRDLVCQKGRKKELEQKLFADTCTLHLTLQK